MTSPMGGRSLADVFVAMHVDASRVPNEVRSKTSKAIGDAGQEAGRHFGSRMAAAIGAAALAGATFIGVKLVQGMKQATAAASDLNETTSKISVIFGQKNTAALNKWADAAANAMGQSKKQALDAAATFGIFGKAAGKSGNDLNTFSTNLVGLTSDMASFANTSPADAIESVTAALRGEFDPIEKYGVLINQATLQQTAFQMGLIKTTKQVLTPQQRILAVQAELYRQLGKAGSGTLGDFARTSAGLANQQRIAAAQTENLRARIGQGLLPVALAWTTMFNTKLIPVLNDIWTKQGPAISAWLSQAAVKFGEFANKLGAMDWKGIFGQVTGIFHSLRTDAAPALTSIKESAGPLGDTLKTQVVPALKELSKSGGQTLADGLSVTSVVLKFLADHVDTLAAALPYLATMFLLVKSAQAAANIAEAASIPLRTLEAISTFRLRGALLAHTAALRENTVAQLAQTGSTEAGTVAENSGILARGRAVISMVAQRVATIASTAATWLATAATTALGVAIKFATGPIGLIIIAIGLLVAGVIYAYKHNETFRKIVDAVWKGIKIAIKAVVDWFTQTAVPFIKKGIDFVVGGFQFYWNIVKIVWGGVKNVILSSWAFIRDKVFNPLYNFVTKTIPDAFRRGVGAISSAWHEIQNVAKLPVKFVIETVINRGIIGTFNKVSGFFGGPQIGEVGLPAGFAAGGRIPGQPSAVDNMLAQGPRGLLKVASGEFIVNARQTARNLPLLEAINSGDGFADGGLIGLLRNPVGFIMNGVVGTIGAIGRRFGDNPIVGLLVGMGRKVLDSLITMAKALFTTGGGLIGHSSGGLVGGLIHGLNAYDSGGFLPTGLSLAYNGTGRPEPATPASTMDEVIDLLRTLIRAVERVAPGVGAELAGSSSAMRTRARTA